MNNKYFYITTTLPYVNARPHIGHAVEFVRADVLARHKKKIGFDVFFNTGTDEHGQKIFDSANEKGVSPQQYVNTNSDYFRTLLNKLNILKDVHFVRTTDSHHIKTAQEFWKLVNNNGYIYKKKYISKYCIGCELEKTDSDLVDGYCPDHPNKELQLIDEENYFFKFSNFQTRLLDFYINNKNFVVPDFRKKEIVSFVERGLKDFSISRLRSKVPWGVPVPGDSGHVMYVWFDALTSYLSTLGWPDSEDNFDKYWLCGTPTQYCGQDNLRQQASMWQAMLMAANLPNSHQIIINGFVTGTGGIKMSKSIGNVIDPLTLQEHYGTDAVRYYLLRHIHPFDGSPISYDSFHDAYTANLVNGVGNLTSRLLTMSEKYIDKINFQQEDSDPVFIEFLNSFRFDLACDYIWEKISKLDKDISTTEPFKKIKTDPLEAKNDIRNFVSRLYHIAQELDVLLPETSRKMIDSIVNNMKPEILFQRKEKILF